MLKKLRRRFVLSAVAAVSAVLLILICGINVWNYIVTTNRMDATISTFVSHEGDTPPAPKETEPDRPQDNSGHNSGGRFFGSTSPEMKYMMRYFSVTFTDGEITSTSTDFVKSITQEQAQELLWYS